jgi:hypothetical protein
MISSAGNTMMQAGINNDFSNVGSNLATGVMDNGGLDLLGNGVQSLVGGQGGAIANNLIVGAGGAALNSLSTGNTQGLANNLVSSGVQAAAQVFDTRGIME